MKKLAAFFMSIAISAGLSSCYYAPNVVQTDPSAENILTEITITMDKNIILDGVLFDNETARAFADMLPLTEQLWYPAEGFAKAFNLPEEIPDVYERTRNYEVGGLAYWYEGPSVAIFYSYRLDRTVVPVVNIGRITSDVKIFEEYHDMITIEKKKEELPQ